MCAAVSSQGNSIFLFVLLCIYLSLLFKRNNIHHSNTKVISNELKFPRTFLQFLIKLLSISFCCFLCVVCCFLCRLLCSIEHKTNLMISLVVLLFVQKEILWKTLQFILPYLCIYVCVCMYVPTRMSVCQYVRYQVLQALPTFAWANIANQHFIIITKTNTI